MRPTHLGPWEKDRLGWIGGLTLVEAGLDQAFVLDPVQQKEEVLKIPLESGPLSSQTDNTYPSTRLTSGAASQVTLYQIRLDSGQARITLSSNSIPRSRLAQSFLDSMSPGLSAEERGYLDAHGNGNGGYDVGDLRAYLRR